MKKLIILFLSLNLFLILSAQSLENGKKHFYYQRYHSAERAFHDQLSAQSADAEAWLWLLRSYMAEGLAGKARDTFHLAPVSISGEPYMLVAKGYMLMLDNKRDSARYYFDKAIDDTKGKNAGLLGMVAQAQIESEAGDTDYAIAMLQKAIKRDKNNPALYTSLGDVYLKIHNGGEAYKAYMSALDKDKNYAAANYRLGTIFQSQHNADMYLEQFNKAVAGDKDFAPAYYELYRHYLYTEPAKAMDYFNKYAALADKSIQQEYSYADLLYLNKKYPEATDLAKKIIDKEKEEVQPRLYKLIAYSSGEMKDTSTAITYMRRYFQNEEDSNFVIKDFETMATLFESQDMIDSSIGYYKRAVDISTEQRTLFPYYKKLSALYRKKADYAGEAYWLGKYYLGNEGATNVDLFNWGLSSYRAEDYRQADSVFGLYTAKYPDQGFGYYWRARSNAAIDTALTEGLAIPHYQKLIEVLQDDSLTEGNKKWMLQAYSYLAAYETNTEKDYEEAIDYFDKMLEIDPENADAKKYIAVLQQNLKKEETEGNNTN